MYDGFDGYDAQAEGLYQQRGIDYSSPPDFNYKRLMGLGFSKIEIDTCQQLFQQGQSSLLPSYSRYAGMITKPLRGLNIYMTLPKAR